MALETIPFKADIYDKLGQIYKTTQNWDDLINVYKKYIKVKNSFKEVYNSSIKRDYSFSSSLPEDKKQIGKFLQKNTYDFTVYDQKIFKTKISNQHKWQKKHLIALSQTYSKSPYYKDYYDFFEKLYSTKYNDLIDFNMEIIMFVRDILDIKTKLLCKYS